MCCGDVRTSCQQIEKGRGKTNRQYWGNKFRPVSGVFFSEADTAVFLAVFFRSRHVPDLYEFGHVDLCLGNWIRLRPVPVTVRSRLPFPFQPYTTKSSAVWKGHTHIFPQNLRRSLVTDGNAFLFPVPSGFVERNSVCTTKQGRSEKIAKVRVSSVACTINPPTTAPISAFQYLSLKLSQDITPCGLSAYTRAPTRICLAHNIHSASTIPGSSLASNAIVSQPA